MAHLITSYVCLPIVCYFCFQFRFVSDTKPLFQLQLSLDTIYWISLLYARAYDEMSIGRVLRNELVYIIFSYIFWNSIWEEIWSMYKFSRRIVVSYSDMIIYMYTYCPCSCFLANLNSSFPFVGFLNHVTFYLHMFCVRNKTKWSILWNINFIEENSLLWLFIYKE